MIVLAAAVMLAGSDVDVRHSFVECLKSAVSEAKRQKIGADGFAAFARTTCSGAEEPFRANLISADVQHGMSRKDSASDAGQQVSDYYLEWNDKYAADAPPTAAAAAAAAAPKVTPPAPTPASETTKPK